MGKLSFVGTTVGALFVSFSAVAQPVDFEFDIHSPGNGNLCKAPVIAVNMIRTYWGSDVPVMPDSGTSENPEYVYRNLKSHKEVRATCEYEDKNRPDVTMAIPVEFDRCIVTKKKFRCFRQ